MGKATLDIALLKSGLEDGKQSSEGTEIGAWERAMRTRRVQDFYFRKGSDAR